MNERMKGKRKEEERKGGGEKMGRKGRTGEDWKRIGDWNDEDEGEEQKGKEEQKKRRV